MGQVLIIGDGIVDLIRTADGQEHWYAGGAGVNLATGIARLGHEAVLASCIGRDRAGFRIARHLRDEGVGLINTPSTDPTGVAISERSGGEPRYFFSASNFRRRIAFTPDLLAAMGRADAVVVNALTYERPGQSEGLRAGRTNDGGLFVIDPNPRSHLLRDVAAFRRGLEMNLPGCTLLKVSVEDLALLYGGDEATAVSRLQSLGAQRVLLTRGSQGASLYVAGAAAVHVPAAVRPDQIVDTMGAGDATLAALVDWLLSRGTPDGAEVWRACLSQAMRIAGATCTSNGGGLVAISG